MLRLRRAIPLGILVKHNSAITTSTSNTTRGVGTTSTFRKKALRLNVENALQSALSDERQLEELRTITFFQPTTTILDTSYKVNCVVDGIILDEMPRVFNEVDNGSTAFYIFYTSNDLHKESTAFLTNRGGRYVKDDGAVVYTAPNPIIGWNKDSIFYQERQAKRYRDPSVITGKQMREILRAKTRLLYQSPLQYNARQVEDGLQRLFMLRELGTCRLFRRLDAMVKFAPPDGKVHKVGIIYSDQIPQFIDRGIIDVRRNGLRKVYCKK